MPHTETSRTFRVTVRGRFSGLTDQARRHLVDAQADHDIFRSAYTAEGTLTYDPKIDFFNLRYELRLAGDEPATAAGELGLAEAELFLRTMGFGHRDLKVNVVDMSGIWSS